MIEPNNKKVLVIIPAYNEENNIERTINNIKDACPWADCIVINDCSNDSTVRKLCDMQVDYINLPVNLGIGGAVQAGYQYGVDHDYDITVQVDGDGQHDSQYLESIIAPILKDEADLVIGSRFIEKEGFQSSRSRRIGIKILGCLVSLCCWKRVKDVTSGFRAVNRNFMNVFANDYPQDYPEPESIVAVAMHKGRIKEVPVILSQRVSGVSSINLKKSIYYMIKVTLAIIVCRISFGVRRKK